MKNHWAFCTTKWGLLWNYGGGGFKGQEKVKGRETQPLKSCTFGSKSDSFQVAGVNQWSFSGASKTTLDFWKTNGLAFHCTSSFCPERNRTSPKLKMYSTVHGPWTVCKGYWKTHYNLCMSWRDCQMSNALMGHLFLKVPKYRFLTFGNVLFCNTFMSASQL